MYYVIACGVKNRVPVRLSAIVHSDVDPETRPETLKADVLATLQMEYDLTRLKSLEVEEATQLPTMSYILSVGKM